MFKGLKRGFLKSEKKQCTSVPKEKKTSCDKNASGSTPLQEQSQSVADLINEVGDTLKATKDINWEALDNREQWSSAKDDTQVSDLEWREFVDGLDNASWGSINELREKIIKQAISHPKSDGIWRRIAELGLSSIETGRFPPVFKNTENSGASRAQGNEETQNS